MNFDKFYQIVKSSLQSSLNEDDNLQFYPNKPKMNACSIIALCICAESIGIDSENYLWSKIMKDHKNDFPQLIDRSNFNKRRRRLHLFIHEVTSFISEELNKSEDIFLMDSIPVPICKMAREKRCKFGNDSFETNADKGYSAISKQYCYGYKLHLVTSVNGIFHSMDLTKVSIHDVNVLKDIKYGKMNKATLINDKGYISKEAKIDLFESCNKKLETPRRANQKDQEHWHPVFRKCIKRIETLFSQLCDQMMLKRNYAKSLEGLKTRLMSKIAAVTMMQSINYSNNKTISHLKHALGA